MIQTLNSPLLKELVADIPTGRIKIMINMMLYKVKSPTPEQRCLEAFAGTFQTVLFYSSPTLTWSPRSRRTSKSNTTSRNDETSFRHTSAQPAVEVFTSGRCYNTFTCKWFQVQRAKIYRSRNNFSFMPFLLL